MGGHANARVRGFLHSTTRYMYLEHGCTRFCAGGGRWPGRRNEKSPKYVPNKETRYKMRAHAQRWYRTVVPAAPGRAWGTTWPGPTDTNAPGTIWGRPGAVTGHYEYNNNDNILKPHASGSGPIASATLAGPGGHQQGVDLLRAGSNPVPRQQLEEVMRHCDHIEQAARRNRVGRGHS